MAAYCNSCGSEHDWDQKSDRAGFEEHDPAVSLHLQEGGDALDLSGRRLRGVRIACPFTRAVFDHACLPGALFNAVEIRQSSWRGAKLEAAKFVSVKLPGADFRGACLHQAAFVKGSLRGALLRESDLRGVNFKDVDLTDADLRGCRVDQKTAFDGAALDGCRVDRFTAEFLQRNGMSPAALMLMRVDDDLGTLKLSFAGPMRFFHWLGISAFLLPYFWYGVSRGLVGMSACTGAGAGCQALSAGFYDYISHGGWWSIISFVALLVYNVARGVLIHKTMALSHHEATVGMPTRFRLIGVWRRLYLITRYLVFANVVLALIHLYDMMDVPVPVEARSDESQASISGRARICSGDHNVVVAYVHATPLLRPPFAMTPSRRYSAAASASRSRPPWRSCTAHVDVDCQRQAGTA